MDFSDQMKNLSKKVDNANQERGHFRKQENRYTMVWHEARKKLGLTINEYCLADTIHKLSGNHSEVPGWCYASKEWLGELMGVSRQSIHNMINKLKEKNIIEANAETGYIRSTKEWVYTVEISRNKNRGEH